VCSSDLVFPSLTVEENLRMGGYTLSKSVLKQRMEAQYEIGRASCRERVFSSV
jgi:ABC-type branched-subunit amino acid transport system ATPase component